MTDSLYMIDPKRILIRAHLCDLIKEQQDPTTILLADEMVRFRQVTPILCKETKNDSLLLLVGLRRCLAAFHIINGFTNSDGEFVQIPDFELQGIIKDEDYFESMPDGTNTLTVSID